MFSPDRLPPNTARACEASSAHPSLVPVFCFSIYVVPDPGTMARVLEQVAKRGLVPTRWHSDVIEPDVMQIDIQVVALSAGQGEEIARCIRSIVGVHSVLTTGKADAAVGTGKATAGADRRLAAQVDGHVEDRAADHAHELGLSHGRDLIVQAVHGAGDGR